MAYQTNTYYAPRKKPVDSDRPGNKVVLYDIDKRHPKGQAFAAEGDQVEAYPTTKVQAAVGRGDLVAGKAPTGKGGAKVETLDPNSLHSLGLSDGTIAALQAGGIQEKGDLVAAFVSGDLATVNGIGKGRLAEIETELVKADLVEESGDAGTDA